MDAIGFRSTLEKLGLSQALLARLLEVTPRAVSIWLSGARPVPGPVEAYLRLFTSATAEARLAEVQRTPASDTTMRDGMYSVEYYSKDGGPTLAGYGFVIFEAGSLFGGDPAGGSYNGSYTFNAATRMVTVRVKVTFPPNGQSVFGVTLPYEWSVEGEATFDSTQNPGSAVLFLADGNTVNVGFRFIRALPEAA
jgi:hypothetical protein